MIIPMSRAFMNKACQSFCENYNLEHIEFDV